MLSAKTALRRLVFGIGFVAGKGLSVLGRGFAAGSPSIGKAPSFEMLLIESAIRESADFFFASMRQASIARTKQEIWESSLERSSKGGLILEFGVWKGRSLTWFAQHSGQEVFGFDNFFDGLQEDWAGTSLSKGHFAQESVPKVPGNATLIVGRSQDELPGFLQAHPGPIRLAHFDMDTYQSTLDVLRLIHPRLVTGSVLIFDEFFGYPLWQEAEARAWLEFVDEEAIEFDYFITSGKTVGVELL